MYRQLPTPGANPVEIAAAIPPVWRCAITQRNTRDVSAATPAIGRAAPALRRGRRQVYCQTRFEHAHGVRSDCDPRSVWPLRNVRGRVQAVSGMT